MKVAGMIAVAGSKGGVGTTWLAARLAEGLVSAGRAVVALDLDPSAGDLDLALGRTAGPSVIELLAACAGGEPTDALAQLLGLRSGGRLICTRGVEDPVLGEMLASAPVGRLVTEVLAAGATPVVDVGSGPPDLLWRVAEPAEAAVAVVAEPRSGSLRQARRALARFEPRLNVGLVLNRCREAGFGRDLVPIEEAIDFLERTPVAVIPEFTPTWARSWRTKLRAGLWGRWFDGAPADPATALRSAVAWAVEQLASGTPSPDRRSGVDPR